MQRKNDARWITARRGDERRALDFLPINLRQPIDALRGEFRRVWGFAVELL